MPKWIFVPGPWTGAASSHDSWSPAPRGHTDGNKAPDRRQFLDYSVGAPAPHDREGSHTLFWNQSVRFRWLTHTMISEWDVTGASSHDSWSPAPRGHTGSNKATDRRQFLDYSVGAPAPEDREGGHTLFWNQRFRWLTHTMISEWGVTGVSSHDSCTAPRGHTDGNKAPDRRQFLDYSVGAPAPHDREGSHTLFWNQSVRFRWLTHTMISEWGVTPFSWPYMDIQTIHGLLKLKNKEIKSIGSCFWFFQNLTWALWNAHV